jgi:hypothetical protein
MQINSPTMENIYNLSIEGNIYTFESEPQNYSSVIKQSIPINIHGTIKELALSFFKEWQKYNRTAIYNSTSQYTYGPFKVYRISNEGQIWVHLNYYSNINPYDKALEFFDLMNDEFEKLQKLICFI